MSDMKKRVTGKVNFVYYHDGNLWYQCDDGFKFPVPTSDCGSAFFHADDKAIFFMRWIKKHMKTIADGAAIVHSNPTGDSNG